MKNSEYEKIEFKGSKEGIIIDLKDEKDFDIIVKSVISKIESSKSFFEGAKIYKIDSEFLDENKKNDLKELITSKFNIGVYKIEEEKKRRKNRIKEYIKNVEIKNLEENNEKEKIEDINISTEETKYISKMRSGDCIETRGNVVVMSDMNSGSKIISGNDILIMGNMNVGAKAVAEGNVIVFGKLFGFVHAGSKGNRSSYIAAKNLKPTILQIADVIAEAPCEEEYLDDILENIESEIAFISENRIILETQIDK